MENLFHYYYECSNSTIEFQKKTEKIITEVGVLAGLSFISKYNNHSPTSPDVIGPSANMSMGLSLNFVLPKNQRKWSICNEFIYAPHNETRHTVRYEMTNEYTITDKKSKYIMFKMNNMLRYQYPVKKAFIYFNFGVSTGRGIQKITYQRIESVYHSIINITEGSDIGKTPEIEIGLNYGLGAKYKRFSFEARVESTDGYFQLPKLFSDFSRHYLFLGYKL